MTRRLILLVAFLAILSLVGCGGDPTKDAAAKLKDAAEKTKDAAEKAKAAAVETANKAKDTFLTPLLAELPKIEEKIKELVGDKKTEAEDKFKIVKDMIDKIKAAAPDKWEELKDKLMTAYAELKKMVGL